MDPITLTIMAGMGAYSAYNKYRQGKDAQSEADKQRRLIDEDIGLNNLRKADAKMLNRGTLSSLQTDYITARDNEKAAGLASMYLNSMNEHRQEMARFDAENNRLRAEQRGITSPTNSEIAGDVAGDLANTALSMYGSYKAGQQANITQHNQNEFMKSIGNSMYKVTPYDASRDPESFSNQISSYTQSFKNMFGDSNYAPKTPSIDNSWSPASTNILSTQSKGVERSTYQSNATKLYDDEFLKSNTWNKMKKRNIPHSFGSQLQFRSLGGN